MQIQKNIMNPGRQFGKDLTNICHLSQNEPIKIKNNLIFPQDHKIKVQKHQQDKILNQYRKQNLASLIMNDNPKKQIILGATEKMRMILIDWLVDVHSKFQMRQQTFHLAIKILDQYLSIRQSNKNELQLLGVACLWIASKYEDIYPPKIKSFIQITANTYTKQQLLQIQMIILKALNFNLVKSTPYLYLKYLNLRQQCQSICQYMIQLAILEGINKKYKDSTLIEASVKLYESIKHEKVEIFLLNDRESIIQCFNDLIKVLSSSNRYNLKAIRRKYSKQKWNYAAKISLQIKGEQ